MTSSAFFLQRNRLAFCQQLLSTSRAVISTLHSNNGGQRHASTGNVGKGTKRKWRAVKTGVLGIGGMVAGYHFFDYLDKNRHKAEKPAPKPTPDAQPGDKNRQQAEKPALKPTPDVQPGGKAYQTVRKDLPTFKMTDVAQHNTLKKGVWVTFGVGVYDITKFVPEHPGGEVIMLGAGSAIDPFWHIYQQHMTEEVLELLESFRIGNLHPDDEVGTADQDSLWAQEPKRHPLLKPASERPFNAEPPINMLIASFYTPNDFFYVRNHLPVPKIDVKDYELKIEVEGTDIHKTFRLEDIKNLPKHTITAAVMCGGNRRSEMHEFKAVKGLFWAAAAVGNAKWSGARLKDILTELGVKSNEQWHVIFEGYDKDPTSNPYGASIPLTKALDERGDVILAYEMNGEPLNRDHGYPLRVIIPGVIGARSVKWLAKIKVSEHESNSHWQQNDYKGFNPSTDWDTVDFSKSPAIQNMPVTSAICSPIAGKNVKVEDGHIEVKGYAWSGGGNRIVRVDLTTDGGKTWHVAELEQEKAPAGRHYGWSLWKARLPVHKNAKQVEIWSKAVDSNYNVQPETFQNTWNLRGVLSHAYHRVKVKLVHK